MITLSNHQITIHAISAFQDNYFWLIQRGADAAVVDPGAAAPVEQALAQRQLKLSAIVLTHHHQDHVGGVAALCVARQEYILPVYGPHHPAIPWATHPVHEGDTITLDALDLRLDVLEVPGHTLDHIAYFGRVNQQPILFCGDTLFSCGCGRLFEGTPAQMLHSLNKLSALPAATQMYCAHEYTLANIAFALTVDPDNAALHAWQQQAHTLRAAGQPTLPTTLEHEQRVNPFLRVHQPNIRHATECAVPGAGTTDLQTFATLREMKNRFS